MAFCSCLGSGYIWRTECSEVLNVDVHVSCIVWLVLSLSGYFFFFRRLLFSKPVMRVSYVLRTVYWKANMRRQGLYLKFFIL